MSINKEVSFVADFLKIRLVHYGSRCCETALRQLKNALKMAIAVWTSSIKNFQSVFLRLE